MKRGGQEKTPHIFIFVIFSSIIECRYEQHPAPADLRPEPKQRFKTGSPPPMIHRSASPSLPHPSERNSPTNVLPRNSTTYIVGEHVPGQATRIPGSQILDKLLRHPLDWRDFFFCSYYRLLPITIAMLAETGGAHPLVLTYIACKIVENMPFQTPRTKTGEGDHNPVPYSG